jgi:hypothetical protein
LSFDFFSGKYLSLKSGHSCRALIKRKEFKSGTFVPALPPSRPLSLAGFEAPPAALIHRLYEGWSSKEESMSTKAGLKKYMARVEYRAVQKEAEAMAVQGYCMKHIYDHLHGSGRVTMGLTTFCDYLKGEGERRHSRKKKGFKITPRPAAAVEPSGLARPDKKESAFSHNPNVDLKELGPGK